MNDQRTPGPAANVWGRRASDRAPGATPWHTMPEPADPTDQAQDERLDQLEQQLQHNTRQIAAARHFIRAVVWTLTILGALATQFKTIVEWIGA